MRVLRAAEKSLRVIKLIRLETCEQNIARGEPRQNKNVKNSDINITITRDNEILDIFEL